MRFWWHTWIPVDRILTWRHQWHWANTSVRPLGQPPMTLWSDRSVCRALQTAHAASSQNADDLDCHLAWEHRFNFTNKTQYTASSIGTNHLLVPPVKWSTVSSCTFAVAGPKIWNTLPEDVTSSQSEYTFCRRLKTWLFKKFFLDIIIWYWLHLDFWLRLVCSNFKMLPLFKVYDMIRYHHAWACTISVHSSACSSNNPQSGLSSAPSSLWPDQR